MNRLDFNRQILEEVSRYVESNPEQRFQQILWNLGIVERTDTMEIVDKFYEEPKDTLKKILKNRLT